MGFRIENGVLLRYTSKRPMTEIKIPKGVRMIGEKAFYECENIISVTIPDAVIRIQREAFYGCVNLQSVTIPESVTSIGTSAFGRCKSLNSVIFPENLIMIDMWAFIECQSLTSIKIPDSVAKIGGHAFWRCYRLKEISFKGCTFRGNLWEIDNLSESLNTIISMLESNDFSAKFEPEIRYPFLLNYYSRTRNKNALQAIQNDISEIVPYAIEHNDIESIQALTETDNLITQEYIDFFMELAIEEKRHEIYVLLLNYKAEKIGFKDIAEQFKL